MSDRCGVCGQVSFQARGLAFGPGSGLASGPFSGLGSGLVSGWFSGLVSGPVSAMVCPVALVSIVSVVVWAQILCEAQKNIRDRTVQFDSSKCELVDLYDSDVAETLTCFRHFIVFFNCHLTLGLAFFCISRNLSIFPGVCRAGGEGLF